MIMHGYDSANVLVCVQVYACHHALGAAAQRHLHEATISATTSRVDKDADRRMVADAAEKKFGASGGETVCVSSWRGVHCSPLTSKQL